jgi:Mg-chelatase subunit ChlD
VSTVLLLDCSGSMATPEGSRTRLTLLTDAVRQVLPATPGARVVAFASLPQELRGLEPGPALQLPEPSGGTDVAAALDFVGAMQPRPTRVLLLTDGQPDDAQAALNAAKRLAPMIIDSIYIGPDNAIGALGFLRALALAAGTVQGVAIAQSAREPAKLAQTMLRLTGPAR